MREMGRLLLFQAQGGIELVSVGRDLPPSTCRFFTYFELGYLMCLGGLSR